MGVVVGWEVVGGEVVAGTVVGSKEVAGVVVSSGVVAGMVVGSGVVEVLGVEVLVVGTREVKAGYGVVVLSSWIPGSNK